MGVVVTVSWQMEGKATIYTIFRLRLADPRNNGDSGNRPDGFDNIQVLPDYPVLSYSMNSQTRWKALR